MMLMLMLLPSDDLDESTGLRNARSGIEHARVASMVEIRRYAVFLRVSQHVLQIAIRCLFHYFLHFFERGRFVDPETVLTGNCTASRARKLVRSLHS